jgi:arsenate reductase-like glutaredoxin family protein
LQHIQSRAAQGLRAETHQIKKLLAELMMENRLLKKPVLGDGESDTSATENLEIWEALSPLYSMLYRIGA